MLLIQGHIKSRLACVFAKLRIADYLSGSPKNIIEVSDLTGLRRDLLTRVFRGFIVCGLVCQPDDGAYELTALGAALKTGAPGCLRDVAIRVYDLDYAAWGDLLRGITEGVTPFDLAHGVSFYELLADSKWWSGFNDEMAATSQSISRTLAAACDFEPGTRVVDIAGGTGVLLGEILCQSSSCTGILFDLPSVVAKGQAYMRSLGVADRCTFAGGDFFEVVPSGADVYILNRVLHNWNDDRCLSILTNCREAMESQKTLVVIERIMPEKGSGSEIVASDLMMLVLLGGCERTIAEFESLLNRSGFDLSHATIAADSFALIEATA